MGVAANNKVKLKNILANFYFPFVSILIDNNNIFRISALRNSILDSFNLIRALQQYLQGLIFHSWRRESWNPAETIFSSDFKSRKPCLQFLNSKLDHIHVLFCVL